MGSEINFQYNYTERFPKRLLSGKFSFSNCGFSFELKTFNGILHPANGLILVKRLKKNQDRMP